MDYAVDGHRVRKHIGSSKKLAELALADVKVKLERQEIGFTASSNRLDELVESYLRYSQAHNTPRSYRTAIAVIKPFKRFVKTNELKLITPLKIEEYKNWRRQSGILPSTVNRELTVIKAIFNRAIRLGLISKNPTIQVKKFKEPKRQVRFFTQEEIKRVLEVSDPKFRSMLILFLNTGLRRDELLHLAWDDIDMERKLLAVQAKEGRQPKG